MQLYYSDFLRLVNSKEVALARIDEAAGRIYFSLRPEAMSSILGSMAGEDSLSGSSKPILKRFAFLEYRARTLSRMFLEMAHIRSNAQAYAQGLE